MVVPSNILLSVAAAYNINPSGTNKITTVLKGKIWRNLYVLDVMKKLMLEF